MPRTARGGPTDPQPQGKLIGRQLRADAPFHLKPRLGPVVELRPFTEDRVSA